MERKDNYGEIYKKIINKSKNNITQSVENTTDGVQNILCKKNIEEIQDLATSFLKAKNYEGIISLIDNNFEIIDGNIIINHGGKYRGMDGKENHSMLINLYSNKELDFKKAYFLIVGVFGKKLNLINNILSEFIKDEQIKKVVLSGDFELKNHGFKLIKKETIK